jgi:ketosteroid isomerase-like protein
MSQEDVEIVRRMYEAFHGGDADGALAYFDPEVVADHSRRLGGGIGHGPEELRRIITEWVGTWEGFREEIEEIRDLGSLVFVIATQHGRGKGSGVQVENHYALLYEVRGEKITWMATYPEPAEALEAAGLSE